MYGVGGRARVESTEIDELTIGDATFIGIRLFVAGEHDFGDAIDVILGEAFFYNVDVEFDLAHSGRNVGRARRPEHRTPQPTQQRPK